MALDRPLGPFLGRPFRGRDVVLDQEWRLVGTERAGTSDPPAHDTPVRSSTLTVHRPLELTEVRQVVGRGSPRREASVR